MCAYVKDAVDANDSVRVLRRVFKQQDLVLLQFVLNDKIDSDIPLLSSIAPHRSALSLAVATVVVMPKTEPTSLLDAGVAAPVFGSAGLGDNPLLDSLSPGRRQFRLHDKALKSLRLGQLDQIDYYKELVVQLAIADANGKAHLALYADCPKAFAAISLRARKCAI